MNVFKIAVIHSIEPERTLLAKTLSCASDYEFIQNRNIYEWERLFHIDESQIYCFQNQFLLMASSFIERIKSESENAAFISNGAVFSEVLKLKSKMDEKTVGQYRPQEIEMIDNLLNITGRYAAHHYDLVIHVKTGKSANFDELSVRFYEKYHVAYNIYDAGNSVKDVFENIIREVELPLVKPVEMAIYEAERLVIFKTRKS